MTTTSQTYPLQRERNAILAILLLLAVAAWAVLIWRAQVMDDESMGLTMGMSAPLFIAIWAAMMVAIMFPTAAPMILTFARVQANRKERGQVFIPTWLFVSSYLLLWITSGLLAYIAARLIDSLAEDSMWFMDNGGRIGGAVLVVAGLYQLSPLKAKCLGKCRTPMSFILNSWRSGYGGAIRMGLEHAAYCFGCCWLLFVILFPVGMMNIAALAVVSFLIFAEKSLTIGTYAAKAAAVALIVYGAVVIIQPAALPTMM
jgi:predicted metal-binding membrane protein